MKEDIKENKPLVSVIIPTYKRPDKLRRAINSVVNQTYQNWELFVVDDNDKKSKFRIITEDLIEEYKNNSKIYYLKHRKNRGGSAARNTGIRNSNGEHIALLDDDDYWLPDKLHLQVCRLENLDQEWGGVYTQKILDRGKDQIIINVEDKGILTEKVLLLEDEISTSSLFLRRIVFEDIGYFDEKFERHQDVEF